MKYEAVQPKVVTRELVQSIKNRIVQKLIPISMLISEKAITDRELLLDPTDITDNNNIKVARQISEKVFSVLPHIIEDVRKEIEIELGEN